jgi:hypothetical protein
MILEKEKKKKKKKMMMRDIERDDMNVIKLNLNIQLQAVVIGLKSADREMTTCS